MSAAQNVRVSRDEERWEVELSAEIAPETLSRARTQALKELSKNAQIKGFRAGHVPEDALVRHFGEEVLLREAAEIAVKNELPELLAAQQLNVVDAPRVTIETPKKDAPLPFSARAPLAPEVKLPDYHTLSKKMNAEKKAVVVTDDEHRETLIHLRRERARVEKIEAGTAPEQAVDEAQKSGAEDLPALDDAFVKSLGYDSASSFESKVREQLHHEKELQAKNTHRTLLIESLVKEATIHYPAILREYELDEIEARFRSDLERIGKTFEHYLAEVKKTRENVREEWREAADKRVKMRLTLTEIARREHVEPDEARLSQELERAQKQYPSASRDVLRANLAHALRNEQVLELLETLA